MRRESFSGCESEVVSQPCSQPGLLGTLSLLLDIILMSSQVKTAAAAAAAAKSLQSCPTLCDPRDCSPPGSPVPGILQARTLEWVAISLSKAWKWKVKVKVKSCPTLSDPMDCSPPGFSVPGIFQASKNKGFQMVKKQVPSDPKLLTFYLSIAESCFSLNQILPHYIFLILSSCSIFSGYLFLYLTWILYLDKLIIYSLGY